MSLIRLVAGATRNVIMSGVVNVPRSRMLYTPATVELVRRCVLSFVGGEEARPSTAESILESGSVMLIEWCCDVLG